MTHEGGCGGWESEVGVGSEINLIFELTGAADPREKNRNN